MVSDWTRTVVEGISQADVIKKSLKILIERGVETVRASGDWCMKKQPETKMLELYNVVLIVEKPELRWHTMLRRGMLLETLDYLLGLNPGYSSKMIKFYAKLVEKSEYKVLPLYGLPFDLFSQSMFLEQMSLATGYETGCLVEVAANFHMYMPDKERVLKRIGQLRDVHKTRRSKYIMSLPEKEVLMHRLDYVDSWPKNRYLKAEELARFLCSNRDYWFDYLELIGIGSDT